WSVHTLLAAALSQCCFLFPERRLPDDQRSDAFCYQEINDTTACRVHIAANAATALRREPIEGATGKTLFVPEVALEANSLLVVPLVQAFERFATDQMRGRAESGTGECGKGIDTRIESRNQLPVQLGLLVLLVVHHFSHTPIKTWHNAHL